MQDRRQAEIELLRHKYGELEVGPNLDWVLFKAFPVPPGWSTKLTEMLVMIPQGYPLTPPDNFYTDNDLFLSGGGEPGNTSRGQNHAGRQWRQFSYHVEAGDWQPHADPFRGHNLLTFLAGVAKRLGEPN